MSRWLPSATRAETKPASPDSGGLASPYEHYADVFSRVYSDCHSIALTLEVLDTYRAREALTHPAADDFPKRLLKAAASLFHLPAARLLERNRRSDVTAARYVAAWVMRRRRWSYGKIARFFRMDHSTIIYGVRKVALTNDLMMAGLKAEIAVDQK